MTILPSSTSDVVPSTSARLLPLQARQQLALDALAGQSGISALADQHQAQPQIRLPATRSRPASPSTKRSPPPAQPPASSSSGCPSPNPGCDALDLGLTLYICHSSLRSVHELLADLFDYPLSLGSIHNILHQAVANAHASTPPNKTSAGGCASAPTTQIFEANRPVLVGVTSASTYCYLLQS